MQTNTKQQIATIEKSIASASRKFRHVIPANTDINWGSEKTFALDIMRKSKDLRAAIPETQVSAILQAGSMGLTLNPAAGECYLIPRRMKRTADSPIIAYASPSYRGLIKTAIESGSITSATAEVVHRNDKFRYFGKTRMPEHEIDVMRDRGDPVGVVVIAKLPNGDVIPYWYDKERILKAKALSDNPNGLMWTTFWQEGWCKTALRSAQKTFPRGNRSDQLMTAMQILNENEGVTLDSEVSDEPELLLSDDQVADLKSLLDEVDVDEGMFLQQVAHRDRLEDIPASRYHAAVAMLEKRREMQS